MKFAIVDLGSNTIRLSVYNTLPEGGFDLLFSEKEMAGLVSYVHGGVLSPEGIQRACGAIRDFQALLRQFDLDAPHVFATASLRNIRNTEEAVEQIRAATGVGVDVISGELEARLGYYGARTATDLQDGAMFDIGGGSTEIVEVRAGKILRAQSLPLGSLNLFKGPEPAHRIPGAVQSLRGRPVAQEKGAGADPQHRGRGPEGGPAAGAPGGTGLRRGRHGPGGAENRQ